MEDKKKKKGRNPLPKMEKKVLVPVWVKLKFVPSATMEAKKITDKYSRLP